MPRSTSLNYSITISPNLIFPFPVNEQERPLFSLSDSTRAVPATLPKNIYVEKNNLVAGDWINDLKRCFIPSYAASQDQKVSEFFISYFNKFFKSESVTDKERFKAVISLADQHIVRSKGCFSLGGASTDISRLEHYILAVRDRLNIFDPQQSRQDLVENCRANNNVLIDRWNKLGFSEEAFWSSPDLVDFVFKCHLHRHITHPYYRHTISMQQCLTKREGQVALVKEPHLLLSGRQTSWSEIRKKIHIDSDSRLYSKENGQRTRWIYLDQGLTQMNDDNFEQPQRLRKLDSAPMRSQVQVITTHAHKQDWVLIDRLLKGTRHSFFRIIPGEGFSERHPEARLTSGEVYSFGWGTIWRDFSFFSPLSTLQGRWFSPDDFEFLKQDQCVTPIDVTDEQIIKLMEIIQRRSKEERPFHFITANCCGITAEVLNQASILDLCTKNNMSYLGYKLFIPKSLRYYIDQIAGGLRCVTPDIVAKGIQHVAAFVQSALFAPIFTLLGAWRSTISYEDEEEGNDIAHQNMVRASNRAKALFSNVFDLFRPSKMEFDLTKNIYKWQKKRPGTYLETRV